MCAKNELAAKPPRRHRNCLGCLARGAIGTLVIFLLSGAVGAIYQALASTSDLEKYPPPGELHDVHGYRLHLYCMGEGGPTVILESGAGNPALNWYPVQHEVAHFTRVCSYDRPGYGWSGPASAALSREEVAKLLHGLLSTAREPAPYVLVGHSAGGEYIRAYAGQYPSEVLGLVLVDSSHESQSLRFPAKFLSFGRIQLAMIRLCDVLSPVGVVRAFRFWDSQNPPWVTSTQLGQATMSTLYRTGYCKAAYAEEVALMVPGNPGEPGSLGDIPLTVISAGALYEDVPEAVISAMGGPDVLAQVARVHDELQLELVGLSTRGKQIIAPKSGHAIHWDHPELVIGAIRELVQQARAE